jgi:hypothetical protein
MEFSLVLVLGILCSIFFLKIKNGRNLGNAWYRPFWLMSTQVRS